LTTPFHNPTNPVEPAIDRRAFGRRALETLTAVSLLECLAGRRLFGQNVAPVVGEWLKQLDSLGRDLKSEKLKDVAFQSALEDLYRRVDLSALLKSLDFDRLAREAKLPERGAESLVPNLASIAGVPRNLIFGRQIFAMKKGRSVIPHGHDNMATGFLILQGTFHGRHWDRVEDLDDHYLIRPTIDRSFNPGTFSTVSDHKDNVHWFTAQTETAFLFNIHVMGYNPDSDRVPARVYLDPLGEPVTGGLIKAAKMTHDQANQRYG
jgi:hypothetical protein